MHLDGNKCSPLKFVSLTRSGSDVKIFPTPQQLLRTYYLKGYSRRQVCHSGFLCVLEMDGKEEHPYWAALCEVL